MALYLFLLAVVVLGCIFARTKQDQDVLAGTLLFIMMMMVGLRDVTCGTDTMSYYTSYVHGWREGSWELLFDWSRQIPEFRIWLIVIALATYIPLYYFMKKELYYMCLGVLVFMISPNKFFTESFNIMRQSFAATYVLGALIYWRRRHLLESLGLLAIGALFHTSSLVALPFMLLRRVNLSFIWCACLLVVSLGLGIAGSFVAAMQKAALGLQYIQSSSDVSFLGTYSHYGEGDSSMSLNGMVSNVFPVTWLCLATYPFTAKAKESYGFYYTVMVFATVIFNIITLAMEWGFRFMYSMEMVQVLVVPMAYRYNTGNMRKILIAVLGVITVLYVYYLYTLLSNNLNPPIPWKFATDIYVS